MYIREHITGGGSVLTSSMFKIKNCSDTVTKVIRWLFVGFTFFKFYFFLPFTISITTRYRAFNPVYNAIKKKKQLQTSLMVKKQHHNKTWCLNTVFEARDLNVCEKGEWSDLFTIVKLLLNPESICKTAVDKKSVLYVIPFKNVF